jgi:hypothetical protein
MSATSDIHASLYAKVLAWLSSRDPNCLPKDLRGLRNTLKEQCVAKIQIDHIKLFEHLLSQQIVQLVAGRVVCEAAPPAGLQIPAWGCPCSACAGFDPRLLYDQAFQKTLHWITTSIAAGCLPHRPQNFLVCLKGMCNMKVCLDPDILIHELVQQGLIAFKGEEYTTSEDGKKRRRVVEKDPADRGIVYSPRLRRVRGKS